jgi:hypothetical protein
MSDELMSFRDAYMTAEEVADQTEKHIVKIGTQRCIRLLQHAATFTKNQFGERIESIEGTLSYKRDNSNCIPSWNVEINLLYDIHNRLGYYNSTNKISYREKSLTILEPWIAQINLNERDRIVILTEERIEYVFGVSSNTESNLSLSYSQLQDWEKARYYQEQSILHAKLMTDGEDKIMKVFDI